MGDFLDAIRNKLENATLPSTLTDAAARAESAGLISEQQKIRLADGTVSYRDLSAASDAIARTLGYNNKLAQRLYDLVKAKVDEQSFATTSLETADDLAHAGADALIRLQETARRAQGNINP
ncbi:MAG: hypothetical protein AAB426_01840 [Myxococcota bacterium]